MLDSNKDGQKLEAMKMIIGVGIYRGMLEWWVYRGMVWCVGGCV